MAGYSVEQLVAYAEHAGASRADVQDGAERDRHRTERLLELLEEYRVR